MNKQTKKYLIDGPAGQLEIAIDLPQQISDDQNQTADLNEMKNINLKGIAFIGHPHPLYGGTMDNKVIHTLVRTFNELDYAAARLNFRGVGKSEGKYDNGKGERDDLLALIHHCRQNPQYVDLPIVLAGFSFGAFVTSHVAQILIEKGLKIERLVLVGTPVGKWDIAKITVNSIIIHGDKDETIPIAPVRKWAASEHLNLIELPEIDHFFHRKLDILKETILNNWSRV